MKNMIFSFLVLLLVSTCVVFFYKKNKQKKIKNLINIVMIGVAGSGKGTQGDLIKDKFSLLKISAGDILRAHRKDPKGKYTQTINKYIDEGKLVPSEITHDLIGSEIEKNLYNSCRLKYHGVIYDGFPRQKEQMVFLDSFLERHSNQINLVVFIDVPLKVLEERLSARYSCSKCGEIYNKISKPTKVKGVCDKCGSTHFTTRGDDSSLEAIRERFGIFEKETKIVLDDYASRNIVFRVDGSKTPNEIAAEISKKIEEVQAQIESGNFSVKQ
jgi:adenylate kinase